MLRPIYYFQILTLIFFSCSGQVSNSETTTTTTESEYIDAVKKGSAIMPPEQDDPVKEMLTVEGTVQKPFDTLSLDFNLSGKKYEVVYRMEEKLYFFDSKSHDRLVFPETGRVLQFVLSSDGKTLYYTVINDETLILKRAILLGNKAIISSIRSFDIPLEDFFSPWTGQGSRIEIRGDTLSIGHGTTNEHYSFNSAFIIVADADSSYLIKSLPPGYYQKISDDYHTHIASVSKKLKLEKKGEHKELFLISDSDTIQLSDTDSIYMTQDFDLEYEVESYENFYKMLFETVQFSPDGSKILYSYPCVLYDFLHGPMYLVNVNGDFLKMLSVDGGFSKDQRPAWLADGNNLVFFRFAKDSASGLFMTINSENDFIKIDENVVQFEIR